MKTNTAMTHFHKAVINHEETWTKFVYDGTDLPEVMWQERTIVSPSTGFVEANEVNVYIPVLVDNIETEDIILKGTTEETNPENLTNYYTVTTSTPCDYGSEFMQHTEVVGR